MSSDLIKPFSVSGKTAVVTGAGSGINLAFTKLLLTKGCNVVIADISLQPEAKALVSDNSRIDETQPRVVFVKTDVTSWPDLQHMFETAMAEFGSFDLVCPGAGVYEPHWSNFWHPPGSSESKDDIDGGRYALFDINLIHPVRTTQLALHYWLYPRTKNNNKAAPAAAVSVDNPKRVVLISSIAGQIPSFRGPMYGASKFAITGFTRCLAELEPTVGVRVNAVAPGLVKTPIWMDHPEKLVNIDQEKDGWVTPEEVAAAMLDCVESVSLVGGTVLEIGKDHTRQVQVYNDSGPCMNQGVGIVASNSHQGTKMALNWLADKSIWSLHK